MALVVSCLSVGGASCASSGETTPHPQTAALDSGNIFECYQLDAGTCVPPDNSKYCCKRIIITAYRSRACWEPGGHMGCDTYERISEDEACGANAEVVTKCQLSKDGGTQYFRSEYFSREVMILYGMSDCPQDVDEVASWPACE
jgi:hypothetical protein